MGNCIHKDGDPYKSIKVLCTYLSGYTQHTPVCKCKLHKRCLPTFRPKQELYDRWLEEFQPESKIYKVCHYCPDKIECSSHNDNSEK